MMIEIILNAFLYLIINPLKKAILILEINLNQHD